MNDPWDVAGWNRAYEEGDTPWHSDDPHQEVVRVVEEGIWCPGKVLDVGCGRGSNLIWLSHRGFEGWGVDVSEEAIRQARARAPASVRWSILSSLEIGTLGEGLFDYVLDVGCYHLHEFTPELRHRHAGAIHSALRPGGELLLICFSPREPADWGGPRRVSREELDEVFGSRFELADIRESQWRATTESEGPWSWVARWKK